MEQWAAELRLAPLVGEGGFFVATWRSTHAVEPAGFPGERVLASAIYFLLTTGQQSAWHQLRADELWFWHRGEPVTLRFGGEGAQPGAVTEVVLGPDIESGQRPQVHIPAGVWQSTERVGADTLMSCVVSPGFDYADFRLAQG